MNIFQKSLAGGIQPKIKKKRLIPTESVIFDMIDARSIK